MEEKKEEIFELDLSTPEGKQQAKERIKEGLFRFNGIDKIFFTNLLFLLLNTISEQEVMIESLSSNIEYLNNKINGNNG